MRFVCDHDVSADVVTSLQGLGHQAWRIADAGLHQVSDDEVTVYAIEHRAVLLTHDREFSRRRSRNVIGWHVQLRCPEWEAADLLARYMDEVLGYLRKPDVFVRLSQDGCKASYDWR